MLVGPLLSNAVPVVDQCQQTFLMTMFNAMELRPVLIIVHILTRMTVVLLKDSGLDVLLLANKTYILSGIYLKKKHFLGSILKHRYTKCRPTVVERF